MLPKPSVLFALRLVGVAAVALPAACAPVGFQDPAAREQALTAFKEGRATMSCGIGLGCMLNWNTQRPSVENLAQADRWQDVADAILANGYDVNLNWFYLGLAAQGLGYPEAARVYYDDAIRLTLIGGLHSCNGGGQDFCGGVNLPDDAQRQMAELAAPGPATRQRQARRIRHATPVAASGAPASSTWVQPTTGSTAPPAQWVAPVGAPGGPATGQ